MSSEANGSAALEKEVAKERTRVEETITAIQGRLTPGQLFDEVLACTQTAGSSFAVNLGKTISANPIPAALVGVGLLWLVLAQTNAKDPAVPATAAGSDPAKTPQL